MRWLRRATLLVLCLASSCTVPGSTPSESSILNDIAHGTATERMCREVDPVPAHRDVRMAVSLCALGDSSGAAHWAQLALDREER